MVGATNGLGQILLGLFSILTLQAQKATLILSTNTLANSSPLQLLLLHKYVINGIQNHVILQGQVLRTALGCLDRGKQ